MVHKILSVIVENCETKYNLLISSQPLLFCTITILVIYLSDLLAVSYKLRYTSFSISDRIALPKHLQAPENHSRSRYLAVKFIRFWVLVVPKTRPKKKPDPKRFSSLICKHENILLQFIRNHYKKNVLLKLLNILHLKLLISIYLQYKLQSSSIPFDFQLLRAVDPSDTNDPNGITITW